MEPTFFKEEPRTGGWGSLPLPGPGTACQDEQIQQEESTFLFSGQVADTADLQVRDREIWEGHTALIKLIMCQESTDKQPGQ